MADTPAQKAAATRKKRAVVIDPNETSAQRFKRVGNARVGKAIEAIRLVGNLVGSSYETAPNQIDAIEKHLNNEVTKAIANLRAGKKTPASKAEYV